MNSEHQFAGRPGWKTEPEPWRLCQEPGCGQPRNQHDDPGARPVWPFDNGAPE